MDYDTQRTKLQKTILIIAEEIDRICKSNNIQYDMDGGTLLGAIRHQGFIPWDDDFDIGMKRREFEKFIEACKRDLNREVFTLQTTETENYAFAFAKVHLNNTVIVEDFSKNVNVHHGVFVDIFPFDNLPNNKIAKRLYLANNHILKNLIWVKCQYGTQKMKRKVSYHIIKFIGLFFNINKLKKERNKLLLKYNNCETEECFTSDYPMYHLKNKWFKNLDSYIFENRQLPGFRDYDEYLTAVFGDYMELPPEEERRVHTTHDIDFGPY